MLEITVARFLSTACHWLAAWHAMLGVSQHVYEF